MAFGESFPLAFAAGAPFSAMPNFPNKCVSHLKESQRTRVVQAGSRQCHQQDLDGHRHHRFRGVLNWPNPLPKRPEVRVAQQSALLLGPLVRTRLRTAGALPPRRPGDPMNGFQNGAEGPKRGDLPLMTVRRLDPQGEDVAVNRNLDSGPKKPLVPRCP